ncbi:hypothetical protein B0A58_08770 [Flavobacterium branchiophilum NBRC 15030 = ATCC 35035]|uniref:Uncharacterized protein DUF1910 n=1 Tax=Flavobacterium branchiophilum TaxID=55197 RepID=A0A543G2A4_9FLAO|nr:PoNe immunity protein domain-containing protein [Flavobacterium branchiophilum]OXA75460.1 hypothetical protein B0A58_08770 [Flavobacterium branchiophilum NBRC 15030 = ATCC 35035]TQM40211.1 uncharacterized protein DUF1910 [Flavobacterium branchiophilum]GEM55832.1 hypothetical protein FB1_20530 [Flavobacterium branchiophilum NBRC 15030 = ATCC 35035]
MGFLDKLFGSSKEEQTQHKPLLIVRAQFRNEKYFNKEIQYFIKIIEILKEDNKEYIKKHGALRGFQFENFTSKYNKLIENYYSLGEPIQIMQPIFKESIENFSQAWSEDYQGYPLLLQMVSFGILLKSDEEEFKKITDFLNKATQSNIEEMWKPDNLIFYLIGAKDNQRKGGKPYEMLYEITQLPKLEAEKAIKDYLEVWFSLHQTDPWYNTHLRDSGYSGYWAWEVAAVVKVMKLNDSSFKDNPYYPYDMVHWNDNNVLLID